MSDEKDREDEVREYLNTFIKWFGGGGFARHVGMTLLILGMSAPFILGVTAIVVVWVWIAPAATNFTERLAAFGVLFGLLTAISVQVAGVSQRMVNGLYLIRRRRKPKPKTPEGEYIFNFVDFALEIRQVLPTLPYVTIFWLSLLKGPGVSIFGIF